MFECGWCKRETSAIQVHRINGMNVWMCHQCDAENALLCDTGPARTLPPVPAAPMCAWCATHEGAKVLRSGGNSRWVCDFCFVEQTQAYGRKKTKDT